jgi:hypothetical protein
MLVERLDRARTYPFALLIPTVDLGSNGCGRTSSLKFQDLIQALDPSSGGPGWPVPLHATDFANEPLGFS